MAQPKLPDSYTKFSLPELKFSHVPADAPTPTPVIILALHRPGANNAFTDTMVTSLVTAFNTLSADPRVKCIVFTGTDPKNKIFCAGMDLGRASSSAGGAGLGNLKMSSSSSPSTSPGSAPATPAAADDLAAARSAHRDGGGLVSLAIYACAKPVIAALNGSAVGVGVTMTLPCNLRVASRDAKVGFVFARRGINNEACSSYFLPRILGAGRALHLLTTGAVLAATDPLLRDLWADVVAPEDVVPRALEIAAEVAAKTSVVASRAMKDLVYAGAPASPYEAFRLESQVFFDLFRGADSREGIRSFLEKREPRFEGTWEEDRPGIWPWWTQAEGDAASRSKL
ncbi:enoyl-CoA hydratase/isomerase [Xylariaceae sp. FL0016]|nr:enoyl-CoA hydratase/isomerase [Xylariaceae sp. FL0016]